MRPDRRGCAAGTAGAPPTRCCWTSRTRPSASPTGWSPAPPPASPPPAHQVSIRNCGNSNRWSRSSHRPRRGRPPRARTPQQAQPRVLRPHPLPQVGASIAVGVRRVARPTRDPGTIRALVERQEPRALPRQPGGHPHLVGVDREVHHHTALEDQVARVPVGAVLRDRVGHRLARRRVLQPADAVGILFTSSTRSRLSPGFGFAVMQLATTVSRFAS